VGQKSGPRVRIVTCKKPPRYGLTARGVRHREGVLQERGTSRNFSTNAVASSEVKSVGEFSPLDIRLEIDGMYASPRASSLCSR